MTLVAADQAVGDFTVWLYDAGERRAFAGIGEAWGELEWRLRYAPEQVSRGDMLAMASLIGSYEHLVRAPQRERNDICRRICRVAAQHGPAPESLASRPALDAEEAAPL